MESAGSAVVDFGRFCTGFLVVMGVGMCPSHQRRQREQAECEAMGIRLDKDLMLMCYVSIALPVLLAHCGMIAVPAMAMSIIGGLLIYGTIISFTMFFHEEQDF